MSRAAVLDNDPARPWIAITDRLPRVGRTVEVWALVDRTAEEDEQACGQWHAAEGVLTRDGRFTVGSDRHAIVHSWRERDRGPEAA
jgi:hypothetical protein